MTGKEFSGKLGWSISIVVFVFAMLFGGFMGMLYSTAIRTHYSSIRVYVGEEYGENFDDMEYTLEDFKWGNIASFSYRYDFRREYIDYETNNSEDHVYERFFIIKFKLCGKRHWNVAKEIFSGLPFVEKVGVSNGSMNPGTDWEDFYEGQVDYEVAFKSADIEVVDPKSHNMKTLVRTLSEWNEMLGERDYLSGLDYDEQFFEENMLAVYAFTKNRYIREIEITGARCNIWSLSFLVEADYGDAEVTAGGTFVIEVKAEGLERVDNFYIYNL
jgi:hypothetical protein